VAYDNGDYYPIAKHTRTPFKVGVNEADTSVELDIANDVTQKYNSGFHFFTTKKGAKLFLEGVEERVRMYAAEIARHAEEDGEQLRVDFVIITCTVKKSWITTVGSDGIGYDIFGKAIVAKKAIFPWSRKKKKC